MFQSDNLPFSFEEKVKISFASFFLIVNMGISLTIFKSGKTTQ